MTEDTHVISGEIQFYWDSGDEQRHLLVNIEQDHPNIPNAYDLTDEVRDSVLDEIEEGRVIEIRYLLEHHELVDPDGATTLDGHRMEVIAARILPE